ncbi:hypothetical protein LV78_004460, partial [Actinosynnema pretiosum]
RIWNATTGEQTGLTFAHMPDGEFAVYRSTTNEIISCTEEAWRWLAWSGMVDGRMDCLPAETFGRLPVVPKTPTRQMKTPS